MENHLLLKGFVLFPCISPEIRAWSYTDGGEYVTKVLGGKLISFGPVVHIGDEIVWNAGGNREFFVFGFETAIEARHRVLVKIKAHRRF